MALCTGTTENNHDRHTVCVKKGREIVRYVNAASNIRFFCAVAIYHTMHSDAGTRALADMRTLIRHHTT